mmetsp:Transcript_25070/g.59171  ORF Transcript_25070/g.59171 Transcript_25070/m.59171 type:complete len:80 (-) Transcript_25070:6-245(-)
MVVFSVAFEACMRPTPDPQSERNKSRYYYYGFQSFLLDPTPAVPAFHQIIVETRHTHTAPGERNIRSCNKSHQSLTIIH